MTMTMINENDNDNDSDHDNKVVLRLSGQFLNIFFS